MIDAIVLIASFVPGALILFLSLRETIPDVRRNLREKLKTKSKGSSQ